LIKEHAKARLSPPQAERSAFVLRKQALHVLG
jgi:hypothetical protein